MTEDLFYKYLNFITIEVDRYVKDRYVNDDELLSFSVEIANFKDRVKKSNLGNELKKMVDELTYNYTYKKIKRSAAFNFIMWIGIGSLISYLYDQRKQDNRLSDLQQLKSQANSIIMHMKMHYSN
jgi:hypothetical protein